MIPVIIKSLIWKILISLQQRLRVMIVVTIFIFNKKIIYLQETGYKTRKKALIIAQEHKHV